MKWLTKAEIKAAAKKSTLAAIKASKKHWYQIKNASLNELLNAHKAHLVNDTCNFCSLCLRFSEKCSNENGICPLFSNLRCCPEWNIADLEFCKTINDIEDHRGAGIQAMCDRLDRLEAKHKGQKQGK